MVELEWLKTERDRAKASLRDLETQARSLDAAVKALRQREVQTKREIEALSALIEIHESRPGAPPGEPVAALE